MAAMPGCALMISARMREAGKKKKTLFNAIITDVRNHGFFIEVAEAGAFGMVPVSSLRDDFYVLNGAGTAFIGRKTKRKFELGHKVQVVQENKFDPAVVRVRAALKVADRIKALTAWDAGAAMARTAKAADSDPPVIRLPLAA